MLWDLLIGIGASLIASAIVGFLGNKAISKQNSNMLKIYVLFLAIITFIVVALVTIILNQDFIGRLVQVSEVNMLKFYSGCINSFVFIIGIVAFVTCTILGVEVYDRRDQRHHREHLDLYKTLR